MGSLIGNIISGSGLPGADLVADLFGAKQKYQNAAESKARMAAVGAPTWFQEGAQARTYTPQSKPLGDKQRDLMQIASAVELAVAGKTMTKERDWVPLAEQYGIDVPAGLSMADSFTLLGGFGGGGSSSSGGGGGGGSGGFLLLAAVALLALVLLRK